MSAGGSLALPSIAALVALSGCARSPVILRESYVAPPRPPGMAPNTARPAPKKASAAAVVAKNDCAVQVIALSDSRSDPTFLGVVGGRQVRSPGQGANWIGGMLSSGLEARGVSLSVGPADVVANPVVISEARLVTAWVSTTATSMNATVVVGVRARAGAEESLYRGGATSVNWASGEGEIQSLMDRAFEQMLGKLSTDLRTRCEHGPG